MRHIPIFPLPEAVLFPGVVLPLQMFEPRYRALTADVLAADGLLTVVTLKPSSVGAPQSELPPLQPVGCLGRVVRAEKLARGGYAILVRGLDRVRLLHEVPLPVLASKGPTYRRFAMQPLCAVPADRSPCEAAVKRLQRAVKRLAAAAAECDSQLVAVLHSTPNVIDLCDVLAAVLVSDVAEQQRLLATPSILQRLSHMEGVVLEQEKRYRLPR
jgi:Lon protease-like protein